MTSQIPENARRTTIQRKYLHSKGFRILNIQYRKYDKVGVKFDIGTLWVKSCYIEHDFSIQFILLKASKRKSKGNVFWSNDRLGVSGCVIFCRTTRNVYIILHKIGCQWFAKITVFLNLFIFIHFVKFTIRWILIFMYTYHWIKLCRA